MADDVVPVPMNVTQSDEPYTGDWEFGQVDFQYLPLYNPNYPVDRKHQRIELAVMLICEITALLTIIARTYVRKQKLKRFRADDWWMIAAGIILVGIWMPSQLAANRYGSGLHWKNVPEHEKKYFWIATWGFSGYYLISSIIKVSICCCHINLLPENFKTFRRMIYVLCTLIMALGIAEAALWNFNCQPFVSNFVWEIPGDTCISLDIPRGVWVAASVVFDIIILVIPFKILQNTKLGEAEKRALMFVFAANLIGTCVCIISIYGIWMNRFSRVWLDSIYSQYVWLIFQNVEVLAYTLGASFPVFSPYLVARARKNAKSGRMPRLALSSWFPSLKSKFTSTNNSASYNTSNSTTDLEKSISHEDLMMDSTPRRVQDTNRSGIQKTSSVEVTESRI